ncbi:DPH4 [Symbiodinium pilosum]|uniref:DPH4 protein n=1 Tax=Symbiodinium pilosum TaxID=2952 RepID=A0A812KPE0_SYMPI|nr:DPH4 [Symbiodinium pilosum]
MTHYSELGISWSASHRAICTAYRQRALQTHPDKGGSHDAYVRVRQAFEVLSDQNLRADYDAELRAAGARDSSESSGSVPTASATGSGGSSASRQQPLVLMGNTPWQEASRTIAGMMDLPESAWAAVLETHNAEVLECCRKQLQRCRETPNLRGQAAKESAACAADGPSVRGLYQTKRGSWEVSLSIQKVQCAIFNVHEIERAHDWHIALVELRRKVSENLTKDYSEREAFREALEESYEADPELKLVLSFRVSIREDKKVINGPLTHRLETALQLRNRVQQLRNMRGSSQDIDKEIRDAKTYEKKQRDLHKARQAAMLQEVLAVLEQLRREEAARKRQSAPLPLPAPEQPEAVDAAPDTQEAEAAEAPAEEDKEDPGPAQVDGYAVPIKNFAKFCRAMSLSKPQREKLVKLVQDDTEVQNAIREAIVRHCGNLRGAPALKDKTVNVPAMAGRSHRGYSTALVAYRGAATGAPRKKGLLELLLEKHEGAFYPGLLTIRELVRVTSTCRRTYSSSAAATKRQLANFRIADFGQTTARSKRGRVLPRGELRELRMLQECLRTRLSVRRTTVPFFAQNAKMPDKRRFALQIQHLDLSTLSASYPRTEHCGSVLYVLAEGDVIHQQAGLPIHARVFAQSSHCLIKAETCALPFLDMLMRRTLLGVSHIAQQRPCNQIKQEGGTQQFWDAGWAGTLQLRTFVNIAKSLKARHAQLLQAHLGSLLGL